MTDEKDEKAVEPNDDQTNNIEDAVVVEDLQEAVSDAPAEDAVADAVEGIETHEAIGYEQNVCTPSDVLIQLLQGGKPMILPLFSPKSAEILKTLSTNREHWHVIAMSQAVAEIFDANDVLKLEIAQKPNGAAMLNSVVKAWRHYVV